MSVPSYFTVPQDPTFPGEMPQPEPVGFSDPGGSALKANADHTHEINIGSNQTPWFDWLMTSPWGWYGAPWRKPQYTRIGNVTIIRATLWAGGATPSSPIELGKIPVDYCPQSGNREGFIAIGWVGTTYYILQCSVRETGSIMYDGPGAVQGMIIPSLWFVCD